MREVRAQISLEFLMVTGVALFLLATSTYFVFDFTRQNTESNAMQQVAQLAYRISDEARNVYVYGPGSFVTITANMPDTYVGAYTVENDTIVFEVLTQYGHGAVPVFSEIAVNGTREDGERMYLYGASFNPHPGRSLFRVESMGSWVQVTQIS